MRRIVAALSVIGLAALVGAERQPEVKTQVSPEVSLRVSGVGAQTLTLAAGDIASLPRTKVTVSDRDDQKNTYEGVTVQEILTKAGVGFGQAMRGPRMLDYVVAGAADKYGVVFAIAELSDEFSERRVIVADKVNGGPISGGDGPLRIIVSDEKKHARWVRNVTSLTIRNAGSEDPAK